MKLCDGDGGVKLTHETHLFGLSGSGLIEGEDAGDPWLGMLVLTFPNNASRAGRVQLHGRANQILQRLLIDLLAFVEVDSTPGVAIEAGVEEA